MAQPMAGPMARAHGLAHGPANGWAHGRGPMARPMTHGPMGPYANQYPVSNIQNPDQYPVSNIPNTTKKSRPTDRPPDVAHEPCKTYKTRRAPDDDCDDSPHGTAEAISGGCDTRGPAEAQRRSKCRRRWACFKRF